MGVGELGLSGPQLFWAGKRAGISDRRGKGEEEAGVDLLNDAPHPAEAVIAEAFGCDTELAGVIHRKAEYRRYRPRAAILRSGDRSDSVYLLVEGHAQAIALSFDGRMVLVQEYRPGDIFGEAAISGPITAFEDIAAVTESEAGLFRSAAFVGLIECYPSVALAVSTLLTRRLGQANRRMVEGATLSAAGRIHAELLRQAKRTPDHTIRPLPVFSTFALTVQSTRETVSRTINQLERRGIVRREEGGLVVVAPHRLEELIY